MKNKNDSLGDRMKQYESVTQPRLMNRNPVIIRADGKAFHTFTRGMDRPFDNRLSDCMAYTTQELVKNISGNYFGYTQSDEISLLLIDYANINTQPWFDNKVQKIVSVTASMATVYFNKKFQELFPELKDKWAMFDARVYNIPKDEVVNYFIWRQQDCTRNSIQMLGRATFSHKELMNLSCDKIQDKLFLEKQINWNDIPTKFKRGVGVYRKDYMLGDSKRTEYFIDNEIPVFTQDRNFIQQWVDIVTQPKENVV